MLKQEFCVSSMKFTNLVGDWTDKFDFAETFREEIFLSLKKAYYVKFGMPGKLRK